MTLETHSLKIKGWWQKLNLLPFFLGLWIHCPDNNVTKATIYFSGFCSTDVQILPSKASFLFVVCIHVVIMRGFFKYHAHSVLEDYWLARHTHMKGFSKKCKLTRLDIRSIPCCGKCRSFSNALLRQLSERHTPRAGGLCWSAQFLHFSKITITVLEHNDKCFECFIKALTVLSILIKLSCTISTLKLTG